MNNVIEFNHVWKKYKKGEKINSLRDAIPNLFRQISSKNMELAEREFWVTKDVHFHIKRGEVVGIMGPNGAGKSTVLKLLSRIIQPNKGNIQINGRLSALIEVTAGFHPDLTGRENVYLNGTILGMKKKEIDERFDSIVDFSGVGEFIDTPVKRYSSGMFSRLGFSVAAHMNPDILLVDEVLSVGDMSFQAKCAQKMRELLASGATIVLVSHNLSLVQSLCKRIILLNKGELLKDGPTDEVIPYYENLVFKKQEEELRQKIHHGADYKVQVKKEEFVHITGSVLKDHSGQTRENIKTRDAFQIEVAYDAVQKIESPVFIADIIRSDGVMCATSRSNDLKKSLGDIYGKGKVSIDFGSLHLGPGIYLAKLSVWDQDLIHPFTVHSDLIIRVEAEQGQIESHAVFLPPAEWKKL